ncbi:hypothetical protein M1O16_05280 [Dehalococcoidia bacterium]|nr:hypothetical protein [Dehalococcoidia bacterium]
MAAEMNIVFDGSITLEGPFLEQVWAAYLLSQGKEVVARYDTLGTHHDVLVKSYDSHILYECTGQAEMTSEKIDRLQSDAFDLAKKLSMLGEPPLKEVVLVIANSSPFPPAAKETFELTKERLAKTGQIKLSTVESYDVLSKLLLSGVLGIRLIDNKVYFIGPEDFGIRWDGNQQQYIQGLSNIPFRRFHELPHSFLPSHYWEQRYRQLFEEALKEALEIPPGIYAYYYQEGIKWRNAQDMCVVYEHLENRSPRAYVMLSDDRGFVANYRSRRRNDYYSVYVFHAGEKVDRIIASELRGYGGRLITKTKKTGDYLEGESFSLNICSDTESWSPLAWAEAHYITMPDISHIYVKRGNDVLTMCLNYGVLGFAYKTKNQITLVGPGILGIRRKENKLELMSDP